MPEISQQKARTEQLQHACHLPCIFSQSAWAATPRPMTHKDNMMTAYPKTPTINTPQITASGQCKPISKIVASTNEADIEKREKPQSLSRLFFVCRALRSQSARQTGYRVKPQKRYFTPTLPPTAFAPSLPVPARKFTLTIKLPLRAATPISACTGLVSRTFC